MRVLVWWIQMIARSTRGFFVLDKQATGRCEESRIRFFRVVTETSTDRSGMSIRRCTVFRTRLFARLYDMISEQVSNH